VQRVARSDVAKRTRRQIAAATVSTPKATREAEAPTARTARKDTRFKPGNQAAARHLIYSVQLPPGLEDLPAQLDRFMVAQLADEGDEPDRLSARRRSLLHHRVFIVERNIRKLAHTLDQKGLVDTKGKLRVAWLQMLGTFIDKAIRLDTLLGLDRRPRKIESPIEWLERRSTQQQIPQAHQADQAHTGSETADEHAHSNDQDQDDQIG
jgi:hypothetical protein